MAKNNRGFSCSPEARKRALHVYKNYYSYVKRLGYLNSDDMLDAEDIISISSASDFTKIPVKGNTISKTVEMQAIKLGEISEEKRCLEYIVDAVEGSIERSSRHTRISKRKQLRRDLSRNLLQRDSIPSLISAAATLNKYKKMAIYYLVEELKLEDPPKEIAKWF